MSIVQEGTNPRGPGPERAEPGEHLRRDLQVTAYVQVLPQAVFLKLEPAPCGLNNVAFYHLGHTQPPHSSTERPGSDCSRGEFGM